MQQIHLCLQTCSGNHGWHFVLAEAPLEEVKRAANKIGFLIVLQEQKEGERNLPYANVTYNLFLLSIGTKRPLIHYKKRVNPF